MSLRIAAWVPAYNQAVNVNLIPQFLSDSDEIARRGHTFTFWSTHSCDLPNLRNKALWRAIDDGHDYLAMCDSDVYSIGGGSPIARMLDVAQATGAALVGAAVKMRQNEEVNLFPVELRSAQLGAEPVEVDAIGTGLVLIDLRQVREIALEYRGPFFARCYEDPRQLVQSVGEDVFFCRVLRGHGRKVVCSPSIPTSHSYQRRMDYKAHGEPITGVTGTQTREQETQ